MPEGNWIIGRWELHKDGAFIMYDGIGFNYLIYPLFMHQKEFLGFSTDTARLLYYKIGEDIIEKPIPEEWDHALKHFYGA